MTFIIHCWIAFSKAFVTRFTNWISCLFSKKVYRDNCHRNLSENNHRSFRIAIQLFMAIVLTNVITYKVTYFKICGKVTFVTQIMLELSRVKKTKLLYDFSYFETRHWQFSHSCRIGLMNYSIFYNIKLMKRLCTLLILPYKRFSSLDF